MLAAWAGIIQFVDALLLVASAALCVFAAVWRFRRDRLSNPLRGLSAPSAAPPLQVPLAMIFGYFATVWVLIGFITTAADRDDAATLGSAAFMRMQMIDASAKLLMTAVMAAVLILMPTRWEGVWRLSAVKMAVLAVGSLLALTALMTLQLKAGEILWRWAHPLEVPPVHPVLQCLHKNAWGVTGTTLFALSAVVVAPLAEEFFFRGILAPAVWHASGSAWAGAILSGVAFGAIHGQPQDIAPLVTLGIALAALRFATGSLGLCVAVHSLFNARTIAAALLAPELLSGP